MKKRLLVIIVFILALIIYSKYKMNAHNPEILLPLISSIEEHIEDRDKKNTTVSKVDIAWQLDHMLKTINRITDALEASDPNAYDQSINAMRIMSLTAGYIPRGRAQSPSIVRPPEVIDTESIFAQIDEAKRNIEKLKQLDENSNFDHPVFGQLDKSQSIRFIEVHTNHHLKIVRDILDK